MTEQQRVEDEQWDCLIILDACRFDYFSQLYHRTLIGKLAKRVSLGSSTPDWFASTFKRRHSDIIYVSGNPFINGLSGSELEAVHLFHKVIDVWEFAWNDELGTVHPQEINKVALETIREFPSHRFIIHYLQPHAPYISTPFNIRGFTKPKVASKGSNLFRFGDYVGIQRRLHRCADSLGGTLVKMGMLRCEWTVREVFSMPPAGPMDATRRQYGMEGVRTAYVENLVIVLQYVRQLCSKLLADEPKKKILVTSDHGERLGDDGPYSHISGSNDPILREVPWLEVSGTAPD